MPPTGSVGWQFGGLNEDFVFAFSLVEQDEGNGGVDQTVLADHLVHFLQVLTIFAAKLIPPYRQQFEQVLNFDSRPCGSFDFGLFHLHRLQVELDGWLCGVLGGDSHRLTDLRNGMQSLPSKSQGFEVGGIFLVFGS